jgi:hypothetical protein
MPDWVVGNPPLSRQAPFGSIQGVCEAPKKMAPSAQPHFLTVQSPHFSSPATTAAILSSIWFHPST